MAILEAMLKDDETSSVTRRLRASSREIAVAIALTVAAVAFLVTALMGDKGGDGSPVAAVERFPEKM